MIGTIYKIILLQLIGFQKINEQLTMDCHCKKVVWQSDVLYILRFQAC